MKYIIPISIEGNNGLEDRLIAYLDGRSYKHQHIGEYVYYYLELDDEETIYLKLFGLDLSLAI